MGSAESWSRWHDDQAWVERLQRDQELLEERIGHEQMMALGTFLNILDRNGLVDFLVVYGRAAREGLDAAHDIDFYFEAARIRDENDPDRHIEVDEQHEGVHFHAYGWPSGALITNLRAGDGFVFGLVRDALIFVDRGLFREALAAIDDESLGLAPGESMDKEATQLGAEEGTDVGEG
jgi:hypothetical protein